MKETEKKGRGRRVSRDILREVKYEIVNMRGNERNERNAYSRMSDVWSYDVGLPFVS